MHGIGACLSAQPCPSLLQPHGLQPVRILCRGISQARILEWVAISSSRGSSQARDQAPVSYVSTIGRGFVFVYFYHQCHLGSPKTYNRYLIMKRTLERAFHIVLIHPLDLVSGLFLCQTSQIFLLLSSCLHLQWISVPADNLLPLYHLNCNFLLVYVPYQSVIRLSLQIQLWCLLCDNLRSSKKDSGILNYLGKYMTKTMRYKVRLVDIE